MNLRVVVFVLSLIGALVSVCMFPPALCAALDGTPDAPVLFRCALVSLSLCLICARLAHEKKRRGAPHTDITVREAFAIVSLSWVVASVIAAAPYTIYGTTATFTDGFFEAMSGFTTTGASILTNIESNPRGILLWRAITHWLGGMGIIVLSLTVLPFVGGGGMQLFRAESPGPVPEKLTPRLQQTAAILWGIYVLLTAAQTAAMMWCGADLYASVTHSFATVATGGFSIYNDSIAHFHSAAIEWVVTFFTFLAGVNFSLHFLFLTGRPLAYWHDEEFRWYLGIVVVVTLGFCGAAAAAGMDLSLSKLVRHSAFQTVTLLTTTGFYATDTLQWPYLTHVLQIIVMLIGGCAGSTSGGLKVVRVLMVCKHTHNGMIRALQPQRVLCVRVNGKPQNESLVSAVLAFFVCYLLILIAVTLFLAALGIDVVSSLSGALACFSNVGPALGLYGPASNYASVPAAGKWALSFAMLVGRLEITTVMLLFLPSTWWR